jgi:hypothetical protein
MPVQISRLSVRVPFDAFKIQRIFSRGFEYGRRGLNPYSLRPGTETTSYSQLILAKEAQIKLKRARWDLNP